MPRLREGAAGIARVRGAAEKRLPLVMVRIEPLAIPKMSLTGSVTERVDTRVVEVLFRVESLEGMRLYPGPGRGRVHRRRRPLTGRQTAIAAPPGSWGMKRCVSGVESHTSRRPSSLTAYIFRLSPEKTTPKTLEMCPRSVSNSWPVAGSHTRAVLSNPPVTMRLPPAKNVAK